MGILIAAPLALAQLHDGAQVVRRGDDFRRHVRLPDLPDSSGMGHIRRAVHRDQLSVIVDHFILHVRGGRYQVKVELPFQPLLDDLHVEQPQEAAAEAETQGGGSLWHVAQRSVVQA
ncbi:hypothetical protein ES703_124235 [subsurface metagenome]